VSDLGRTKDWT